MSASISAASTASAPRVSCWPYCWSTISACRPSWRGLLATLRRQAASERNLHSERDRLFSAVVESSNDAIITKALDGTITALEPGRRAPVRIYLCRSGRPAHRHHRSARTAHRGRQYPRPDRPRRTDRAIRDLARAQGRPRCRGFAEHLADPVGHRRNCRRFQDRARYDRKQADAAGAQRRKRRNGSASSKRRRTSSWSPTPPEPSSRSARASRPSSAMSRPT